MKYPFLALLAERPHHGYELKQELERRFASLLPPLNAGQVYTTLQRLERDGLVSGGEADSGARNRRVYELTDAGREALRAWVAEPAPGPRLKDEFFMKLVLAGDVPGAPEARTLIDRQRAQYLQALRDLGELQRSLDAGSDAASLLVDGAALHVEADLRWLELCEQRLIKEAR